MSKLRHIALSVRDLQESAEFYERAFGMERVRESDVAVMLSDGVVSLALLDLKKNENTAPDARGKDYIGLHHMGFIVDNVPDASEAVEAAGCIYHGQIKNIGKGPDYERKFRDPNGVVVDVTSKEHVEASWKIPTD